MAKALLVVTDTAIGCAMFVVRWCGVEVEIVDSALSELTLRLYKSSFSGKTNSLVLKMSNNV